MKKDNHKDVCLNEDTCEAVLDNTSSSFFDECGCCFDNDCLPLPPYGKYAVGELYHELHRSETICHVLDIKNVVRLSRIHWHDNIEIAVVLNHKCGFLVDGVLYEASPGDMIVTEPRMTHQFQPTKEHTRYLICQLSKKSLQNGNLPARKVKQFIRKSEIDAFDGLTDRINTLLEWLEAEPESTADNPNLYIQSLAASLYYLLARYFPQPDSERPDEAELREFHMIFRYVTEHFLEDITVTSIARKLYLTRAKVSALFTKYAGTTPSGYIRELRIDTAKRSLANGTSITKAALESGFQNVRTFNNTFKAVMGMTPSEYLRQMNQ